MGKGNTSDGIRKAREDYFRPLKNGKEFTAEQILEMRFRLLPLSACLTLPKGY